MALKTDLIAVWCEGAAPVTDLHTNGLTLTNNNTVGTTTGKVGTAGVFDAASSRSLSRADESLLSTGDISWTEAVWVKLGLLGGDNKYISSKGDGVADERVLLYRTFGGENLFRIYIAQFAASAVANTFGQPALSTWYYLQAQHDAANNLLRIRVNDGAWDEAATGGTAPTDGTAALYIGAYGNGGSPMLFFEGHLNQYAFWKAVKSDADLNAIYNSGNGLAFSSWDAGAGDAVPVCWPQYRRRH